MPELNQTILKDSPSEDRHTIIDEFGYTHITTDILGEGGQGKVFRLNSSDMAFKEVPNEEKYLKRFNNLLELPLPEGLNISFPQALVHAKDNDVFGYIMPLLDDMVSFSKFSKPPFLGEDKTSSLYDFYIATGGTKRRLHALAKLAAMLARLHGNGFYYGDLSPANIYMSENYLAENLEFDHIWLIDADNINLFSDKNTAQITTPGYGAPEIASGKSPCTPFSDCYSFAIICFEFCSLVHPFSAGSMGDLAAADNWDASMEVSSPAEEDIPWIDDPIDQRNRPSKPVGFPRAEIFSPKLLEFFQKTFSETGRLKPNTRPKMSFWARELAKAADQMVICEKCGMSFFLERGNCPNTKCAEKANPLVIKTYHYAGNQKGPLLWTWALPPKSRGLIPARVFGASSFYGWDTPLMEINASLEDVTLKNKNRDKWFYSKDGQQWEPFSRQIYVSRSKKNIFLKFLGDFPLFIEISLG